MKRNILRIFFLMTVGFSIFSVNTKVITNGDTIVVDLVHQDGIIFNNYLVLFDVSNDIKEFMKPGDVTADVLKQNKFIYELDDLNKLHRYTSFLQESIIADMADMINNDRFMLAFSPAESGASDLSDDTTLEAVTDTTTDATTDQVMPRTHRLIIGINELIEGEYNLIKNVPAKISIVCYIIPAGDTQKTTFLIKRYRIKSEINFPIARLRMQELSRMISHDLTKAFKNKFIKVVKEKKTKPEKKEKEMKTKPEKKEKEKKKNGKKDAAGKEESSEDESGTDDNTEEISTQEE